MNLEILNRLRRIMPNMTYNFFQSSSTENVETLHNGVEFELRTNHSGLKYLFEQPNLNARKIMWIEFISEHYFDIKHFKGKHNKVVDAFSIRIHALHAIDISM